MHNNILLKIDIKDFYETIYDSFYKRSKNFITFMVLCCICIFIPNFLGIIKTQYLSVFLTSFIIIFFNIMPLLSAMYLRFTLKSKKPILMLFGNSSMVIQNIDIALRYYFWKKKFKNADCFIDQEQIYLKANSNHGFIEYNQKLEKNPMTKKIMAGKILIAEYLKI